jgi:hypothetical protein
MMVEFMVILPTRLDDTTDCHEQLDKLIHVLAAGRRRRRRRWQRRLDGNGDDDGDDDGNDDGEDDGDDGD